MKKWIALLLAALMMFSLAACGEEVNTPDDGNSTSAGNTSTPNGKDPCDCCPDCNQEECECAECGDSTDCKCKLPGGGANPPLTYDIEIDVKNLCPDCGDSTGCGMIVKGTSRVTMNFIDSKTGYLGSSTTGTGKTVKNGMHSTEGLIVGDLPSYKFNAQLSLSGDHKTISVGFDRLGPDEFFYKYSIAKGCEDQTSQSFCSWFFQWMMDKPIPAENGLVVYPDTEKGLLIFELPLKEGEDKPGQQFKWENIFISITLTPVP